MFSSNIDFTSKSTNIYVIIHAAQIQNEQCCIKKKLHIYCFKYNFLVILNNSRTYLTFILFYLFSYNITINKNTIVLYIYIHIVYINYTWTVCHII